MRLVIVAATRVRLWRTAAVTNSEVISGIKVSPDNAPTPPGFASAG